MTPQHGAGRRRRTVALSVLALGALAACGGDDGDAVTVTAPADATLTVEALNLKFDQRDYTVAAGDEVIAYLGLDAQYHTLAIVDAANERIGEEAEVNRGDVDTIAVNLQPGSYSLICTVPGHAAAGMVATLTVT